MTNHPDFFLPAMILIFMVTNVLGAFFTINRLFYLRSKKAHFQHDGKEYKSLG
jgi:hypothetical protein